MQKEEKYSTNIFIFLKIHKIYRILIFFLSLQLKHFRKEGGRGSYKHTQSQHCAKSHKGEKRKNIFVYGSYQCGSSFRVFFNIKKEESKFISKRRIFNHLE